MPADDPEAYSDPNSPHFGRGPGPKLVKKSKKKSTLLPDPTGRAGMIRNAARKELTGKKNSSKKPY